ncbi:hypothetical protein VA596_38730 [Amycolatopsis sp., V23-08]|uniref:Uncharacterized protein n=1 Tax=Amycolatopsis heterodermiae TaxID=3110235 RepID=A0ABU5RIU8_9PSEU|nr:hypothetical protein [Amycolatopsis sp., V23-08]MEA5365514.1 hypothetical protein [Amycolatopsis sp., V23-08]
MSRFVRPALWTFGLLVVGGLGFWLVLALNIPYRTSATPETTQETAPPTASATTPYSPPVAAPPADMSAWVIDVRPGPDDHSAVLHVNLPDCAVGPHVQVTEAANRIDAAVMFQPKAVPDCEQAPVDFPMKTAAPIGKRPVIVNAEDTWGLAASGWKKCDKILGCDPPADHCDKAWVAQAEFSAEAEYPGTTRACDQNWLIHDLQRHGGQAPNRVAYRWAGDGWSSFASASGGGCGEILAVEPKFPTSLCRNLAPTS